MSLRRAGAEFLGTFVLVFGGVGAAVIAGEQIGFLGIAFAFGLSLLAMAYAIGPVSGCHINPAVTMGLLVSGRIDIGESVRYWAAQILGAIAAPTPPKTNTKVPRNSAPARLKDIDRSHHEKYQRTSGASHLRRSVPRACADLRELLRQRT